MVSGCGSVSAMALCERKHLTGNLREPQRRSILPRALDLTSRRFQTPESL